MHEVQGCESAAERAADLGRSNALPSLNKAASGQRVLGSAKMSFLILLDSNRGVLNKKIANPSKSRKQAQGNTRISERHRETQFAMAKLSLATRHS